MKTAILGSLNIQQFTEAVEKGKVWFVSNQAILKEFEIKKVNKVVKYSGLDNSRNFRLYVNVFKYSDNILLDRRIEGLELGNIFDHYSNQGNFFENRIDMSNHLKHLLPQFIRKYPKRLDLLVENFPEILV
jgi:hypothetical protein